jgi:predicted dehydrogenase/threonine dehydrogenase-like Zn-dependent dehydrogenase
MKQVTQSLRTGAIELAEVPAPAPRPGHVVIRTSRTLVSTGTERMLVEFGQGNLLQKARQQPDKVQKVIDKMRKDGIRATLDAVFAKFGEPVPLGYCNMGRVVETGPGVRAFAPGDRVVSNGKHAEVVAAPVNLCAAVPADVTDEEAAFTIIGAIALQGIRLIQPTLGETVVVQGLGLIGLIAVQILRASGCRVIGVDLDQAKLELAARFGATTVNLANGEDPIAVAMATTGGHGVDGVVITASTTSNEPIHQAAQMCRKRGRIVLVGVVGLSLSRGDFYEKELTFQVSCSYGPGRYDPNYEEKGQDYPFGFVRWTEQRNMEAVLGLMASGKLDVKPLITHRYSIDDAAAAYKTITDEKSSMGVILEYPQGESTSATAVLNRTIETRPAAIPDGPRISFIGSGNYAQAVLIPAFAKSGARFRGIASNNGLTARTMAQRFGFERITTSPDELLHDTETDAVIVATRHDSHADYVVKALNAGKHVFVEKPLALSLEGIDAIAAASAARPECQIMIGFNRRFSPLIQTAIKLLRAKPGPHSFLMTVNAGALPGDHWAHDSLLGGGRIVGEACHFLDLLRFLAGAPAASSSIIRMAGPAKDTVAITLGFDNGCLGTIVYYANGGASFPKERLEIFSGGSILQLDDFRNLTGYSWPGFRKHKLSKQDKGQLACTHAFALALANGSSAPIPRHEIFEVSRLIIDLATRLDAGQTSTRL